MHPLHRHALSTVVALVAASAPASAVAQEAAPVKPVPDCNGIAFIDPQGDAVQPAPFIGSPDLGPGDPQLDITQVFFTVSSEGQVLINIRVVDLVLQVPGNGSTLEYYAYWLDDASVRQYATVLVDANGGTTYEHGFVDEQNFTQIDGTTTGEMFLGKDGIVQIALPDAKVSEGAKLKGPYASSVVGYDFVAVRSLPVADTAPDGGSGRNQTPKTCAAPAAPVVAVAAPPPSAPLALPHPEVGAAPLTFSARRAKKRARFEISTTVPLEDVTVVLTRAGRKIAEAELDELDAEETVTLRLRRRLSAGGYSLVVSGTGSGDQEITKRFRVRVRK